MNHVHHREEEIRIHGACKHRYSLIQFIIQRTKEDLEEEESHGC